MQVTIQGRLYTFTSSVRQNPEIRRSFNELAGRVFDLDFEPWYQSGWWGDGYQPYALVADGQVVANASFSLMTLSWRGRTLRLGQIGTVMTHPDWRGKGCSGWLMKRILDDWQDRCDALFLFGNDSVVNFYPKFGFKPAHEYEWLRPSPVRSGSSRKLDMELAADRERLLERHRAGNPFAALSLQSNPGMIMFYCSQFMRNHIHWDEAHQAVVIAEPTDDGLLIYDIFGGHGYGLDAILAAISPETAGIIRFGFTPLDTDSCRMRERKEEDSTFFVLARGESLFDQHQLMIPLLAHT